MADFFYEDEQHRNKEYAQNRRHRRTEDDDDTHGNTRGRAGARSQSQRDRTYDEGQRRHDDRTETNLRRFNGRRYRIHAPFIDTDFSVFDNQDGVFSRQADNGENTDLK